MSFSESVLGEDQSKSAAVLVDRFKTTQLRSNSTRYSATPGHSMDDKKKEALNYHKTFLSGFSERLNSVNTSADERKDDTETTPLFSGIILDTLQPNTFKQYGLLGEQVMLPSLMSRSHLDLNEEGPSSIEDDPRIFLNVSPPWSAFICGSQGSGKSYTLSCMLENCLISSKLGQLQRPLTGMVFHYDTFTSYGSNQVCEAAYLCSSGIPVRVLVSSTNFWTMKEAYENLPNLPAGTQKPEVIAMKFQNRHLDVMRMMNLMAVNKKEGAVPLYIEVSDDVYLIHVVLTAAGDSTYSSRNGN